MLVEVSASCRHMPPLGLSNSSAQRLPQSEPEAHMLDLKSFHIVLVAAAIMLMSGLGVWGLLNDYKLLGIISLAIGILLIPYGAYFAARFQRT